MHRPVRIGGELRFGVRDDAGDRIAGVTFVPVAFDQWLVAGGVVEHRRVCTGVTSAPCDDRPLTDYSHRL